MSRFHMASEIICKCEGCLTNMTLEFTVFMIFFEMFFHGILWGKRFETNLTFFLPFFFEFFLHWYIFFGFIIIFIIYYIVFLVLRLIKQWIKILFCIYLSTKEFPSILDGYQFRANLVIKLYLFSHIIDKNMQISGPTEQFKS